VDVGGNKAVFDPVWIFGDTQEPVDKKTAEVWPRGTRARGGGAVRSGVSGQLLAAGVLGYGIMGMEYYSIPWVGNSASLYIYIYIQFFPKIIGIQ
jgi:hypothetical protein